MPQKTYWIMRQFWLNLTLGVGNVEKNITSGLHTPTFDIDESALEIGGGLMAYSALANLQ